MDAVGLACFSALVFGAMTPILRFSLQRSPNPAHAALGTTGIAFLVCTGAAVFEVLDGPVRWGSMWPFVLAGLVAPGASQLLFMTAVREAGPSRTSVVVGAAPLVSVAIALTALHEPLRAPLLAGAVLVVLGGFALASERTRPEQFRMIGLGLAFACTFLFSSRDNLIRWLSTDVRVPPIAAAAATAAGGAVFLLAYLLATRAAVTPSALRPYLLPGLMNGISYLTLFEAYYRGRVTVVSPLVATESLWGVAFAALLVGRSELIGRRLVAGAVLIVAGGALIGAFR